MKTQRLRQGIESVRRLKSKLTSDLTPETKLGLRVQGATALAIMTGVCGYITIMYLTGDDLSIKEIGKAIGSGLITMASYLATRNQIKHIMNHTNVR